MADFFADRLTVQERWLVFGILVIVVTGSFVKYCRARPELMSRPASVAPTVTPTPTDSDP